MSPLSFFRKTSYLITVFENRFFNLPSFAVVLLALFAGALQPLAFAPFNYWPLAILGLCLFFLLVLNKNRRQVFVVSASFGVGLFGVGVSWVYVSIHLFGNASVFLALLLTGCFVVFLGVVFSLPFVVFAPLLRLGQSRNVLIFSACYLLGEWSRSWLLTGFPWLYLGYGHDQAPLAGWAPIVGVIGLGFLICLTAATIASWFLTKKTLRPLVVLSFVVVGVWLSGGLLQKVNWTHIDNDKPIHVAMVQPNIPQALKWDPEFAEPTLAKLTSMSEPLWDNDWIVWPEAAVPKLYHQALPFLNTINQRAHETHTGLVTGIIYDDKNKQKYYNSIAGFGDAMGIYHKRRLVPFGEYVPLADWLRNTIEFFNLPTSYIHIGPANQNNIQIADVMVAPTICYEVVYPALVAESVKTANVLLTVSNDAWFADSLGPLQHMQMAQMRAIETGRFLIRSTNNGVSAIVNHKGKITVKSEQFVSTTVSGIVYPAAGVTPFMRWGLLPLLLLAFACIVYSVIFKKP